MKTEATIVSIEENGSSAAEEQTCDVPREYMLHHMVCDFAETVRWWMQHEQYSAEEISRFFFSTTPF